MDALITNTLIFSLGAAIGSFLNVVVYRLPAGLSLLHPASHCPCCHQPLKPYDNVPILAWLKLRGRCRYCRATIPKRYPLTELTTGLLFLFSFWLMGWSWWTVADWILLSLLLTLSLIDLDTLTLPDILTQSGLLAGLVVQTLIPWLQGEGWLAGLQGFQGSMVGAVLGLWLFNLITIVASLVLGQTAMGGGDAKLAAMLGAWLGWRGLLLSSFLACALGALLGGGAMVLGLIHRRQPIPFGPFLALGAALTLVWGDRLIKLYQSFFFLVSNQGLLFMNLL
jgi:leader peptidase (prepilin peptidase)/N-methyltransferase